MLRLGDHMSVIKYTVISKVYVAACLKINKAPVFVDCSVYHKEGNM